MSDDNKTRIITPQAPATDNNNPDVATRMYTGNNEPGSQTGSGDDDPKTRVLTGHEETPTGQNVAHDLAVGWIVVIEGPGRGCTKEIFYGMNSIGRSSDERIPLDFGDTNISRTAHAYIVFDEKQSDFYIQHGGKSNLVRINDAPVLSPIPLKLGDIIEIGATKLMFVPLCGDTFKWENKAN